MRIDTEKYDYRNLKPSDKAQVDAIENTKQNVLNKAVVEDFLETNNVNGDALRGVYRDVLGGFVEYLKERCEYCKIDFIMETIDNYTEAEYNELRRNALATQTVASGV